MGAAGVPREEATVAMGMTMSAKELSLVPARGALGATMLYHGAAKLRGDGPQQAAPMFESMGLKPGERWAKLTGLAEVLGGATAILGIGTRLGALAVLVTQGVAVAKVHRGKGFDNLAGGYEFNLLLMAAALGLLLAGPGTVSAHELVERQLEGRTGWLRRARPRRSVRIAKLLKSGRARRRGAGGRGADRGRALRFQAVLAPALAVTLSLAAAVPYAADEAMEFAVDYHGVPTGKARISVGHAEGDVLPVFLQARTSGLLAVVNLKQSLASYLDTDTGLPRSASIESIEPGYRRTDTTRFDRVNGKATVREKGKHDNTYEIDVPAGTVDFVALVFKLRTLPLEPGTTHDFQVLSKRTVQRVVAQVEARERVETKAGKFDAVKVRVPTQFSGKFSEKSPTYVWFSDDARRIVVRIATEFGIGRVVAALTAYTPGKPAESARARP